jgi:hypothetical protein
MMRAASCTSRSWLLYAGKFGFRRTATVAACGTSSRNSPSRFGSNEEVKISIPVAFPPVPKRLVVQVWDSMEKIQAWRSNPEFVELRKIGAKYAKFRTFAVEGLPQ